MYIKLTFKVKINLHDLNNERGVGNYVDIRTVWTIDSQGNLRRVPAISGNMLKHWHFIYMKRYLESKGYDKFCKYCKQEEAYRVPPDDLRVKKVSDVKNASELEKIFVETCAIEDAHGFLFPGGKGVVNVRRESRIKFSWMIPAEGFEAKIDTATHTRVARAAAEEEQQQMIFYKQYSSGIYGFSAAVDLSLIGYLHLQNSYIDKEDVKIRREAAVMAFLPLLGGEMGASLARALPLIEPLEALAISSSKPIPLPVPAIYKNYLEKNAELFRSLSKTIEDLTVFVYPAELANKFKDVKNVVPTRSLGEFFQKILEKVK